VRGLVAAFLALLAATAVWLAIIAVGMMLLTDVANAKEVCAKALGVVLVTGLAWSVVSRKGGRR